MTHNYESRPGGSTRSRRCAVWYVLAAILACGTAAGAAAILTARAEDAGRRDLDLSGSDAVLPLVQREAVVDLGYVECKSTRTVTFSVLNPWPEAMAIRKVRSECACMKVDSPPAAIAASGLTDVRVRLDARVQSLGN